jgi:hypothetical protein
MVRFMIYLLETGICLSLLYLAYWLFLRKETYFNFNRLFLVGSILLALTVPLLHVTLAIPQGSTLENPARRVLKFRQNYEELVRQLDADFGTEPGRRHSAGMTADPSLTGEAGRLPSEVSPDRGASGELYTDPSGRNRMSAPLSITDFLFILYIGGVFYFFARFVYLVVRLFLLARKNRVVRQDGFRMVEIEDEIAPFSFFRFLFIHHGSYNETELQQVMEHEKAHIRQKHSTDHLFAHALAVFQWFNPFAWQIRKALKSTHEYIADRQVIRGGIERIDYQSFLLEQLIGYHSVELVNNFNLKPIKKRIAMMNKDKSGWPARLKATLVAPFALIVFFLFADFTLNDRETIFSANGPDLTGLWIRQSGDDFGDAIFILGNSFSFSEGIEIRDFHLKVEEDALVLTEQAGSPGTSLRYQLEGDRMDLWWNNVQRTIYLKSPAANTLDDYLLRCKQQIDLPSISRYRLMEPETSICRIGLGKDQGKGNTVTFNGRNVRLEEVNGLIEKEREKIFLLDQPRFTVMFLVDREVPMSQVDRIRQELRKTGSLHIAEGGYPHGNLELSPLIYHAVGLPRLLPPLDALTLGPEEIDKLGADLYTIDLSARNLSPREVDEGLQAHIRNSQEGKYVISLVYDGEIPYGQYVETVDMIWNVVYKFREELSLRKYNLAYDELGEDLQREIRKTYPMALSEHMLK